MRPLLFVTRLSPPCRAVLMTAQAIDLELEIHELDMAKGEHLKSPFINLNPLHCVPTLCSALNDEDFVLSDSHAIMPYLVATYSTDAHLYPANYLKRAEVNKLLYFDSGVCWPHILMLMEMRMGGKKRPLSQFEKDLIEELYICMENFLEDKTWLAGNKVTIADFSLLASMQSANVILKINSKDYPRLAAWLRKAEQLPGNKATLKDLEDYRDYFKPLFC